jgi:predicted RNA binding protein YcfA (HicA-like mRNA interferase family)
MSYSSEAAKVMRTLKRLGYEVELTKGTKHYRITHPDHSGWCSCGSSPSDHRWLNTLRKNLRHTFGESPI